MLVTSCGGARMEPAAPPQVQNAETAAEPAEEPLTCELAMENVHDVVIAARVLPPAIDVHAWRADLLGTCRRRDPSQECLGCLAAASDVDAIERCDETCFPPDAPGTPLEIRRLDAPRLKSGNRHVTLRNEARAEALRQGLTEVTMVVKFCANADGSWASTRIVQSSNFETQDRGVEDDLRGWRHEKLFIGDEATAFCYLVDFRWEVK
jgi:outer membrane biosynthesis protein TonB